MKKKICTLIVICSLVFSMLSCSNSGSKFALNSEGLVNIEKELKSKFGEDAYYSEINAIKDGDKTLIVVKMTKDTDSRKIEEWVYDNSEKWDKKKEHNLEIGSEDPKNFLFQLGEVYNLQITGKLLEDSIKKAEEEKNLKNLVGFSASIMTLNVPKEDAKIIINIVPENDNTRIGFVYNLNGELIEHQL